MSNFEPGFVEPTATDGEAPFVFLSGRPPLALQLSERGCAGLGLAIGVVVGLIASLVVYALATPDGMLHKAFNPGELHSAIPYAISCVFFWGLALCFFRSRRLKALARIANNEQLENAMQLLRYPSGADLLHRALAAELNALSPLLRRLRVLIEQWLISPNLQDGESVLSAQVMLDGEASARGYSLIRVIVWALPVLGLIGTVLGIADAVGGFANFLGQDVSDVAQIRHKLVDVTGGLSFAFLITLQGLLTSLIVMLMLSALQSAEERLFASIHQGIVERFLPLLQQIMPPSVPGSTPADTLRRTLRELAASIIPEMQRVAAAAIERISAIAAGAGETIKQAGEASVAGVGAVGQTVILEMGRERAAHSTELRDRVQEIAGVLEQVLPALHATGTAQTEVMARLQPSLEQLSDGLGRSVASQAALEHSLHLLAAGDLARALQDLHSALDQLGPVLARFQQPFSFQLVPAQPG